jgi:prepilin-type N-terminal cleavage/methylation domain-containing protein
MIQKAPITACHPRQRGFALTELLFAVGIMAIVLGAISAVISTQLSTQTAQKEGGTIQSVVDDLKVIFLRQPSFIGVDMVLTTTLDLWPTNRVVSPGVVTSAWGSVVGASTDLAVDPTGKLLRIDIPAVTNKGCPDFAAYAFSAARMTINGQVVFNTTTSGPQVNPLDVALAVGQCADATSDFSIWFSKDYF